LSFSFVNLYVPAFASRPAAVSYNCFAGGAATFAPGAGASNCSECAGVAALLAAGRAHPEGVEVASHGWSGNDTAAADGNGSAACWARFSLELGNRGCGARAQALRGQSQGHCTDPVPPPPRPRAEAAGGGAATANQERAHQPWGRRAPR